MDAEKEIKRTVKYFEDSNEKNWDLVKIVLMKSKAQNPETPIMVSVDGLEYWIENNQNFINMLDAERVDVEALKVPFKYNFVKQPPQAQREPDEILPSGWVRHGLVYSLPKEAALNKPVPKPFDIDKALAGAKLITRDGRPARLIRVELGEIRPLTFVFANDSTNHYNLFDGSVVEGQQHHLDVLILDNKNTK